MHSFDGYKLEKLIAAHDRTITSLSWCPSNPNFFATSAVDLTLMKWEVNDEKEVITQKLTTAPMMIDWCGHDESVIAVLLKPGSAFLWILTQSNNSINSVLERIEHVPDHDLVYLRWNHKSGLPKLAIGHQDGTVYIWDKTTKNVTTVASVDKRVCAVTDMQWDPLSNNYLLVTFANGYMSLIDTESGSVMMDFAKQSVDISMTAFIRGVPGGFLTANARAPILALWNVSQKLPVDLIKVGHKKTGISAIKATAYPDKFLLTFEDGSVAVFNYERRRLEFCTQPGHSETIFDCRFKPSSPDILATASYDGTVKLWDTHGNMRCLLDMKGQEGVIYAISWCPGGEDEHRLASGSSLGEVFIWDTKTGLPLQKLQHHEKKPVYRLAWNQQDASLIASTSSDGNCVVFTPQGQVLRKYNHQNAVYGCDWNRFNKSLLCTGCHDAVVRVFDVNLQSNKPVATFSGHSLRVFNTVWSPLVKDLLCSGSDDRTIRVWSMSSSKVLTLNGHSNNVRALVWSDELPFILLSGSWDGTIRIWDVRAEKCLHVVTDHHADVYGLASHPRRPFVYASSSRDTTLRFWGLDETLLNKLRLRCVISGGQLTPEMLADVDSVMKQENGALQLCGAVGHQLAASLKGAQTELECFARIFNFFSGVPGVNELWDLVASIAQNVPCPASNLIQHADDLRNVALSEARSLQESHGGFGQGKREERLKAAADVYMKLGRVREYCEVMCELEQWERAIAIAPAVSVAYWKQLCARYARVLRDKNDEQAVPFLLATADVNTLLEFQGSMREWNDALLCAVSDAVKALPVAPSSDEEAKAEQRLPAKREAVRITERIRHVVEQMSGELAAAGNPVYAACCHLAIGQADRAVHALLHGHEVELAWAVAHVLKLQFVDHVHRALALRCEQLQLWDEAYQVLKRLRDSKNDILFLASRYAGNAKADFYAKVGIRSRDAFLQEAESLMRDGDLANAVKCYVAGSAHLKAVEVGVQYLKDVLSRPTWGLDQMQDVVAALHSVQIEMLDQGWRYQLLCYCAFFAVQVAMWRGYTSIISCLFDTIRTLITRGGFSFPVSPAALKQQEVAFFAEADPVHALKLAEELLKDVTLPAKTQAWLRKLSGEAAGAVAKPARNVLVPSASNLPSGNLRRLSTTSYVSKKPIQGTRFVLEDGVSCMSLSEALMWSRVTPFSPLHTGGRLNLSTIFN